MLLRIFQSNISQSLQIISQFLVIYLLTKEIGTEGFSLYIQYFTWISLISVATIGPITILLLKGAFSELFNFKYTLVLISKMRLIFFLICFAVALIFEFEYSVILAIIIANINLWSGNAISLMNYVKKNQDGIWISIISRALILVTVFVSAKIGGVFITLLILSLALLVYLIHLQKPNVSYSVLRNTVDKKKYSDVWLGVTCENFSQRVEFLIAPLILSSAIFSILIPVYSFFLSLTIPVTMLFKFIATELIFKVKEGVKSRFFYFKCLALNSIVSSVLYILIFKLLSFFIDYLYVGVDVRMFEHFYFLLWPGFVFFCLSRFLFPLVLNLSEDNTLYRNLNFVNFILSLLIYTSLLAISKSAEMFILSFTILNLCTFALYFFFVNRMVR